MDIAAQNTMGLPRPVGWVQKLLQEELAPYPGRGLLVARMVIAATLIMILSTTFRIPYGLWAVYGLAWSRESTRATVRAVKKSIGPFVLAAGYVILGAMLSLGDPALRILWLFTTLFLVFFVIGTITDFATAGGLGILIALSFPLWDQHILVELKVESTLWAVGQAMIASLITAGVALAFEGFGLGDDLLRSIGERLASVEKLLDCYAKNHPPDEKTTKQVTRMAVLGTSMLRSNLQRSNYSPRYAEQMGAVAALVGRLVDIAASMGNLGIQVSDENRERIRLLAENIADIRADLLDGRTPHLRKPQRAADASSEGPMLPEMERTVSLIAGVFVGSQSLSAYTTSACNGGEPPQTWFVRDALSNPEHIKFALKGCLAASLCYLIYSFLNWPGISTSVTTCMLTALTTIGASHQKQVLRFSGAMAGGAIGIASQVFVLPQVDSIFGFTVLFLAVTIVAAWVTTSGPRLSYFGIQLAAAFYFVNLDQYNIQTSLVPARDRVVGILLGLSMMWLIFDQLWGTPAAIEMRKAFVSNLRSLAQLAREPDEKNLSVAIRKSYSLREQINLGFNNVRALGDAVLFELGPSRKQDLALRSQILRWQPQLRMILITRVFLLKYRLNLPGFELAKPIQIAQQEFDEKLATTLNGMADRLDGKASRQRESLGASLARLEAAVGLNDSVVSQGMTSAHAPTFLILSRRIESLAASLDIAI
jgi:multidrug resistance protein MdtO